MELFDFVRVLFTDPKKYSTLRNVDKSKHFFMINRFMSIKHPITAQSLNRVGTNSWAIIDLWQIVASRFSKVPGWIYTKTKKSSTEKAWKPNSDVAAIWMQRNEVGERELKEAIRLYPDEMKKSFSLLEKQIQMYDR
jgi:hypothetical protein